MSNIKYFYIDYELSPYGVEELTLLSRVWDLLSYRGY